MPAGKIGNKVWSLQDIKDAMRNPTRVNATLITSLIILQFKEDPRLHAALVSSAISSPNLARKAYKPEEIDHQYNISFNEFISNINKGMSINTANNKVQLSAIFDWYVQSIRENNVSLSGTGRISPTITSSRLALALSSASYCCTWTRTTPIMNTYRRIRIPSKSNTSTSIGGSILQAKFLVIPRPGCAILCGRFWLQ